MSAPVSAAQVFALPDYRNFLTGRFIAAIAQHIQTLAVGLYVYELTRDPLALGVDLDHPHLDHIARLDLVIQNVGDCLIL